MRKISFYNEHVTLLTNADDDNICAMFYKVKVSYHYLIYVKQMGVYTSYKKITTLWYEIFVVDNFF